MHIGQFFTILLRMGTSMRAMIVALMICAAAPARASDKPGPDSANFWFRHCTAANGESAAMTCTWYIAGYVAGLDDGAGLQGLATKSKVVPHLFCIPKNVTYLQYRLIVSEYMKRNPQMLHHAFGSVISIALSKAFPCNR